MCYTCNAVNGGLRIIIGKVTEESPYDENNLEQTSSTTIKKVKDITKIDSMHENTNLKEAYLVTGKKSNYRIEVYENNFNGDDQEIISGILASLSEK